MTRVSDLDATISAKKLADWRREGRRLRLLDVRRAPVFAEAADMLPEAVWNDPSAVERWVASLAPDQPIVAYCVHGHEVSRGVVAKLRAAGLEAYLLEGGIEAWRAAREPTVRKPVP